MFASQRANGIRAYVCRKTPGTQACGSMSIVAETLEAFVLELLLAAIDEQALATALKGRETKDDGLLETVRQDEVALESLASDFYVERLLSREEFFSARASLQSRLEENRAKLARRQGGGVLAPFLGKSVDLRQVWERSSLDWRRSFVGALLDRVIIQPATIRGRSAWDPSRIQPVWRY